MKKLFVIAFLTTACMNVHAQFGVKGGVNFANWGGEDADEEGKKGLVGFYAGVFYNIPAGKTFSVQPELVYSVQGITYEIMGITAKVPLGYINLTPLFRYNNPSGFFIGVGPQVGFLMSAKVKAEGQSQDIKDSFKGVDIAGALAVGYEMQSGFGFYARYNHGFTSISDDDSKISNRVFQLGLRYKLNLSK